MINHLLAVAELYHVDLDTQYQLLIVYFVSLVAAVIIRKGTHGWLRYVLFTIFIISFCALWYVLMLDHGFWKFVIPVAGLLGGLSGISSGIHYILKAVKNIGDDDSFTK